jgi:hypothetical protein
MIGTKEFGERGRNRTFNLLIKSQLLCQLSYAPIAVSKVGTNFDYSIRGTEAFRTERVRYWVILVRLIHYDAL